MAKYHEICDIIKTRIAQGHYMGGYLPNVRQIAEDMGVSYLTARQAILQLKTQGILENDPSGRRFLVKKNVSNVLRVALIIPFWNLSEWHLTIRKVVLDAGGVFRVFSCINSTDTIIDNALNDNYDLVFIQFPENPPPRILERMSKCKARIVTLFQDFTSSGIRMVQGAPLEAIDQIMGKLATTGHKVIDYLQVLTEGNIVDPTLRYDRWLKFIHSHQLKGEAHLCEVPDYSIKEYKAHEFCLELLENFPLPDAYFCATIPVAVGLYRACYEKGIVIGKDISVFSFGGSLEAPMMTPALATIRNHGVEEMIQNIVMQYKSGKVSDQLLYQNTAVDIFEGESLKFQ